MAQKEKKSTLSSDISKLYRSTSDGWLGLGYDALNAGLYLAAPLTGGLTLMPAMAMTGALAIGAGFDAYENGFDLNNTLDLASAIPGFGLTEKAVKKLAPRIMARMGKTTKLVDKTPKLFTRVEKVPGTVWRTVMEDGFTRTVPWNFDKTFEPLWKLAKDKAYRPYAGLVYGEDLLNHMLNGAQIINDIEGLNKEDGAPKNKTTKEEAKLYKGLLDSLGILHTFPMQNDSIRLIPRMQ